MVVIIVSVVIIVERVIFQKKSAIFFCDNCDHFEHCDYCRKRGHFSEKVCNVFLFAMVVSVVIIATRWVIFQKKSARFFVMIVSIVIIAARGVIFQNSSTFFYL